MFPNFNKIKINQERIINFYKIHHFDENKSHRNPKNVAQFFTFIEKNNTLTIDFNAENVFKRNFFYNYNDSNMNCTDVTESLNRALEYKYYKSNAFFIPNFEKKSSFPYFSINRKFNSCSIKFSTEEFDDHPKKFIFNGRI